MKKLILSVMASIAVISLPAFAHDPVEDNENLPDGTSEMINENLEAMDSPHLYLLLQDMGSGGMNMNMNIDADLDRSQAGDQTGAGDGAGDASGEKHENLYQHVHKQVNFRQGAVPDDQEFDWGKTRTRFRAELSTNSAISDDGLLKLYLGDKAKITSELMVDQQDVGKSAQCLVVAQYKVEVGDKGEASNFMLSEEGWRDWKGGLSDLAGVKCELGEIQRIVAYDGELFSGEFDFYFGYKLGDGKIVHSHGPFSFSVQ